MHAIAAINIHRSFKHWRILPRKFLRSWIDRWAAAVLGAHTAWFALTLSKDLYKWFISDVNFIGRLTFLRTCFMNSDSKKIVREKENNLVFVLGRRKRNADYAQRSNQRPTSFPGLFPWRWVGRGKALGTRLIKGLFEATTILHDEVHASL